MSNENDLCLEKTQELYHLFQIPREERDQEWLEDFFAAIPEASLRGFEPQIQRGPDGFPYLLLSLPSSGEDFDAFSVSQALPFCLQKGCGIAIFSDPAKLEQPEWIFTFGSLWSYDRFKNFIGDPADEIPESSEAPSETEQPESREVQIGIPSDDYLPKYARTAIGRFLKDVIGLEKPRVALIMDPTLKPSRALMFADLKPESFEQKEHFSRLMNALRWFLPATRGLMPGIAQLDEHSHPL